MELLKKFENIRFKSIEQGASTTVWAAVAKELDGKGCLYLENCEIGKEGVNTEESMKHSVGLLPYCLDAEKADKLWDLSVNLTTQQ